MGYAYNSTNGGFYDCNFPEEVPECCVWVTDKEHAALFINDGTPVKIEPDENGFPVRVKITFPDIESRKNSYKERMKESLNDFISSGALVSMTVGEVAYTGCCCPQDVVLQDISAAASYKNTVDDSVPNVACGSTWFCKDVNGNRLKVPMRHDDFRTLVYYVKNWGILCSRIYNERVDLMLAMTADQIESFDPEQDMVDNLPSRNIVIP